MTVRDVETLELLKREPELLAIADAVSATQRHRRRVPARALLASAAVLAAAVVALVAPWEDDSGRGFVAGRALAALPAQGPVLHVVLEFRSAMWVELETGRARQLPLRVEYWYDEERGLLRTRAWRESQLQGDRTIRDGGDSFDVAMVAAFAQSAAMFRKALEDGRAHVVGEGRVHGREVFWLEATSPEDDNGFDVAIDRNTYELVQTRGRGERAQEALTVLTFEYLGRRLALFAKPGPSESIPASGHGASVNSLPLAKARDALGGGPALWAGPAIGGRKLEGVELLDVDPEAGSGGQGHGKALELTYGAHGLGPPKPNAVSIAQAAADDPGRDYLGEELPPPDGFAELQSGTIGSGTKQFPRWTAFLRHGPLLVRIAGPSRRLVLDVARALRPIP